MGYTLEQLDEAIKKNHTVRQELLKNLLSIASVMLTILASFSTTSNNGSLSLKLLFLTTLVLLTLGILGGGIALYFDTVAAKSMAVQMKQVISKQLSAPDAIADIVSYDPPKIFYISEKICYIALLLSVVSIALYAGLKVKL